MAGIRTLNIGVFTELIDSCRLHRITQCKFVATCWTSCFDIASAARNSNFGGKHKTKSANKRSCNRTSDILSDILTFSAVFQRIQRHSAASNRTFRYIPSICNRSHGRAGCCHSRHSGRRCCNSRHVCIARRIETGKDSNGLTHDRTACPGERFPSGRVSLQCLDCGVATPHSSHCYRRCYNRRHSGRGSHYRIERCRVCDDRRHSGIMRHKMPNF
nr:MAG TPA: hypothetical protein [Caudoviricetes sp.]